MQIAPRVQQGLRQNALLAALPEPEWQRLLPQMQLMQLETGSPLENGSALHAWFPASCVLSLQYVLPDGASIEVACVGNEGMAGLEAVMAGGNQGHPVLVRASGAAWRIPASLLAREFSQCPGLQCELLQYSRQLLEQVMQSVACNRHHAIEQQLCRCLLSTLDRQPGNALHMTQEFIAGILGVRRESVTEAARRLQQAGLIHYSRGNITVLDRSALEQGACDCYRLARDRGRQLLSRGALAA